MSDIAVTAAVYAITSLGVAEEQVVYFRDIDADQPVTN
jgi:hypothetical protein